MAQFDIDDAPANGSIKVPRDCRVYADASSPVTFPWTARLIECRTGGTLVLKKLDGTDTDPLTWSDGQSKQFQCTGIVSGTAEGIEVYN